MNTALLTHLASTAIRYPALRQNLLVLGMASIALLALPEATSTAKTVLTLVIAVIVCTVFTAWQSALEADVPQDVFVLRMTGIGLGIVAVILSMFGTILSGLLLIPLLYGTATFLGRGRPFVAATISVIVTPMWVWMLHDQWRWSLLILIPLAALSMLATSHLMDSYAWPDEEERVIPQRAHRAAAWMCLAFAGAMLLVAGLLTDTNRAWLALLGVTLALAAPLEAGLVNTDGPLHRSLRIVSSAFLLASVIWLIAIQ